MPESWKVGLLGGFSVQDGARVHTLPAASQRLVAFLALHGANRRTLVAGNLWPEASEDHALASLRTGVWRVKRALTGLLVCDESVIALSARVELDCKRQELLCRQLFEAGEDEGTWLAEQLHCLWMGDLLPGWYDDWVVEERELLRQLRLHALEKAARLFLREGQVDLALAAALEAVRAEPLRESANSVLISVHVAEGNAFDAMRQYDHFRARLREVGMDPSPAMMSLLPRREPRFPP